MASDSTQTVVASGLTVFTGAVGTTAPTDATTAPGAGFVDAGFVGEDSVNFATNPTFNDVYAHQQATPIRVIKVRDAASLAVSFKQHNTKTWEAAFGGGAVTVVASVATFTPPISTATTPISVIVDAVDGTKHMRLVIPKCRVRSGATLPLRKSDSSDLAVTFEVEATSATVASWYTMTDDVTSFSAG